MSGPVLNVSPDIYTQAAAADAALRQWGADYSAANGGAPVPNYLWGAEEDSLNAVRLPGLNAITDARRDPAEGRAILRDYAEMHGIAPSELSEDEMRQILASENPMAVPRPESAPQSQVTPENVRSTRRAEEEESEPDPCEVGPYREMQRKCSHRGGQAHHIVPDFTLRAGPRPALYAPDPTRLPNAPTLAQGMAICLTGHARATDRTGEHYAAHRVTDLAIAEAGAENTSLPGTATWRKIRRASLDGIKAAKPDCLPAAMAAIDAQFAGMPGNQALRAVMDYRTLPQETRNLLQAGHGL